jgi:signal transduction histidine kinase
MGKSASIEAAPDSPSSLFVGALGIGIAAVLALTVSAQTYLSMRTHGHSFYRILLWQFACWSFWAAAAPVVVRSGANLTSLGGRGRYLRTLALAVSLIAAHAVVAAQCTVWIQPWVPVATHTFGDALLAQLGLLLWVDVFAYAVVLVIGSAVGAYDRARVSELRESHLEAELARANLETLRLEIQPHFLFNTLNAIGALIRRQSPERALNMLIGLSDLLRGTVERRRTHMAPLEAEISFLRKYVDLHRERFSDRLDVTYDLDPAALEQEIPTFILQPLVENAFRHGLARQLTLSRVEVGARVEEDRLRLWVSDNGAGISPGFVVSRDAGTGLSNIKSRLDWMFGRAAVMEIRPRETGGTTAYVVLPLPRAASTHLVAS